VVEKAVARALAAGVRTADIAPPGAGTPASTARMGAAIREQLDGRRADHEFA